MPPSRSNSTVETFVLSSTANTRQHLGQIAAQKHFDVCFSAQVRGMSTPAALRSVPKQHHPQARSAQWTTERHQYLHINSLGQAREHRYSNNTLILISLHLATLIGSYPIPLLRYLPKKGVGYDPLGTAHPVGEILSLALPGARRN